MRKPSKIQLIFGVVIAALVLGSGFAVATNQSQPVQSGTMQAALDQNEFVPALFVPVLSKDWNALEAGVNRHHGIMMGFAHQPILKQL